MRERIAAGSLAAVAWAALLLQLYLSLRNAPEVAHGVSLYLSYFTVLTNLMLAAVATRAALLGDGGLDLPWRGCAVTAIVMVGLSYHLLLRAAWDPQGWQKAADIALHYATPLGSLAWWLAFPPRQSLPAIAPIRWLLWPVAYAVYALLRGATTGRYPYWFIDVGALGLQRVVVNAIGIGLAFLLAGHGLRALAHWRQRAATLGDLQP